MPFSTYTAETARAEPTIAETKEKIDLNPEDPLERRDKVIKRRDSKYEGNGRG